MIELGLKLQIKSVEIHLIIKILTTNFYEFI